MKPRSIRRFFGIQSAPSLALVTAITAFAGSAHAATYQWNGTTSNWQKPAPTTNWSSVTAAPLNNSGSIPTFNNSPAGEASRLNVNGATALEYTAAEGSTLYANNVGTVRGLVIGSGALGSGTMNITGGTFSTVGSTDKDIIGNTGGNTGTLTVSGGNFFGADVGSSMGNGGAGAGVLNISGSGSVTVASLVFGGSAATVNLNGGTLALNNFVGSSGANTINFNGGTLKPRIESTTFLPNLANTSAFVKSLGAIVDTDGSDVTISEPLLTDTVSTGGGITKDGVGVLTLGAVSTTTGPAVVSAGGLAVVAGASSWEPSSFTHSGDQLDINLGVYSPSNAVPIKTASLTLNTSVTVNVSASNLPPLGQVMLLDYVTKSGSGSLNADTLPANTTLEEDTVNGYYYLDVSLPPGTPYTWSAASGDWDINTSSNWNTPAVMYEEPAHVTFPDLSGGRSINVVSDVSPISTTFSNNTGNDYSFSGSAITGSGVMIKNGTGTATFANPLTFTGGAYINVGRIQLTDQALSSESITIESGAFLTYDNASAVTQGPSSASGQYLFGAGTLEKKGVGTLTFGNGTGAVNWSLSPGALIDVQEGKLALTGGTNTWTSNKASLNIASGATFDGWDAGGTVDALTGSGTYEAGNGGPRTLTVGINNSDATFSGTIQSRAGSAANSVQLVKVGTGAQTLDGFITVNTQTTYGVDTLRVRGGTLNLSPTAGSVIGSTNGSGVYFSPTAGDVSTVNQTSGALVTNTLAIGDRGQATYSISGGSADTNQIRLGFDGPTTGSAPVVMNVSGTAQVNVKSNGGILMGQYYGRPITVTQTGGNVVFYSDAGVTKGGTGSLQFKNSSTTPTYNLNGGTLSIPAITWTAAGGGSGGGNGTLSFNGGTLQITSAAFAVPTGLATNGQPKIVGKILGDEGTPDSGAIIDNYGLNVTFAAPILHGPVGTFDGGLKLATSVAGGSLTLSGLNTYTGNTSVLAGNTLVLADNAGLTFVLDGIESNKITGAGTVTINGDFTIDTTLAALTNGQTWTLFDAPITPTTFSSSFTLVGFTEAGTSGVHTKPDGANTWTFNEGTGVLSLTVSAGYGSWIAKPEFALALADQDPADDPDNDGMENLLEYVLNGNPSLSDPAILPDVDNTSDPLNLVFTFTRREESATDTTQVFEYGTNLTGWTPVAITGTPGSEVTIGTPSGGLQLITVKILKSAAGSGGKLFGRLKVTKP